MRCIFNYIYMEIIAYESSVYIGTQRAHQGKTMVTIYVTKRINEITFNK